MDRVRYGFHRVPVARRDRHAEYPVEPAQIADHLHVPPVQPEDEPPLAGHELEEPPAFRWHGERQRRHRLWPPGQNAHKAYFLRTRAAAGKNGVGQQPRQLAAMADHYLGLEGKSLRYLGAQLRAAHGPADDERARRADIDGVEMLQAF